MENKINKAQRISVFLYPNDIKNLKKIKELTSENSSSVIRKLILKESLRLEGEENDNKW